MDQQHSSDRDLTREIDMSATAAHEAGILMVMGTLFIPFFWILPLSRAAYARVSVRRERRF
jgi:hypothetical protein